MAVESLWTNQQMVGFNNTTLTLRRIRSTATGESPKQGLLGRFRKDTPTIDSQDALMDAERLGIAAGNFMGARISNTLNGQLEHEEWQDILSDTQKRYEKYDTSTYTRTTMMDVVGNSILGRLRNLHIDPNYMLRWEFVIQNNLGVDHVNELSERGIGILSPLSGDYLLACAYSSYLDRKKGKAFNVRPAALSRNLDTVVLPKDKNNLPALTGSSEIGIYLDAMETGNTGRALFEAISKEYGFKKIHAPKSTNAEFEPSSKIKEFWKKAEKEAAQKNK